MKILLTTDAFPPGAGGSGQSTAALAQGLGRRGHQVTVVVSKSWDAARVEKKSWQGVAVIEVGVGSSRPGSARRREARLASFLQGGEERFESFDLAHAQHWLSGGATIAAGRRLELPVVVTVRDYWPVCIWSTMLSGEDRCVVDLGAPNEFCIRKGLSVRTAAAGGGNEGKGTDDGNEDESGSHGR